MSIIYDASYTFLFVGLTTYLSANTLPDGTNGTWQTIYELTIPAPASAFYATLIIDKSPLLAGSVPVAVDEVVLVRVVATNVTGATGPAGATGASATGATGATGAFSNQYGYIYNIDPQMVASGASVTFSTNGSITAGISLSLGTTITVTSGGDYFISYEVLPAFDALNTASAYAIFVNGVIVPFTATSYGQVGAIDDNYNLAQSSIINIPSGGMLTLRNIGASDDTLQTTTDGTTVVNASIRLFKLS